MSSQPLSSLHIAYILTTPLLRRIRFIIRCAIVQQHFTITTTNAAFALRCNRVVQNTQRTEIKRLNDVVRRFRRGFQEHQSIFLCERFSLLESDLSSI